MRGLLVRGGAVWQLVGLITRRSQVQILPPLPLNRWISSGLSKSRPSGLFFRTPFVLSYDFRTGNIALGRCVMSKIWILIIALPLFGCANMLHKPGETR